jgi:muramoyltetrapeptide carboxypeptidase
MNQKKQCLALAPPISQGDTIGIVAPASHFDEDTFYQGIAILKSMGFHLAIPDELFFKKGYLAGTDTQRARLINRLFSQKEIKAILCARGGFGSIRVLSLLDHEVIRENPKIFVGFSDISALLWVLYTKCNLMCFHGPTVTGLAKATQQTKKSLLWRLTTNPKGEIRPQQGITIQSGSASGPVVGGNLTTLCHLVGTPYSLNFNKKILMIEDKGEAVYRIDRMLSQMKLAGCFDGIKGLVVGSFEDCGKLDEIYDVIYEIFRHTDIPVLAGFEMGHGKTNITVPIGLAATLDADRQQLTFHDPAVSGE